MFETFQRISESIHRFLKRTEYVFSIVKWASESAGKIADILASFPKPPVDNVSSSGDTKGTDSNKGAGDAGASVGSGDEGKSVPSSQGELAGGGENGNSGV